MGQMKKIQIVGAILFCTLAGHRADALKHFYIPAQLTYAPKCILNLVASYMNIKLNNNIPLPTIYLESETKLNFFQDTIEPQWKMRPEQFSSAYASHANALFLINDSSYYERLHRTIDDSLAHEFVHYIQFHYQGYSEFTDDAEPMAIDAQTWFRENIMQKNNSGQLAVCN